MIHHLSRSKGFLTLKKLIAVSCFLLILTGCQSKEELHTIKINNISKLKEKIIDTNNSKSIEDIYKKSIEETLLQFHEDEYKSNELVQARDELYYRVVKVFLNPDSDERTKKRIASFFRKLSNDKLSPIDYASRIKINDEWHLNVLPSIEKNLLFSLETKLAFYTELAYIENALYDLNSKSFIATELCRAVSDNKLIYTSALIDISDNLLDPGEVRCVRDNDSIFEYKEEESSNKYSCPVSLRRLSGINYGRAVSRRISQWKNNNKTIDIDQVKSRSDLERQIFSNIPKLNPVPKNMNSLLDKHNKWDVGHCSLKRKG